MNLVQTILNLLSSGDTLGKIGSTLGIGQDQAGKAVSAAVPSLLAGLVGAVSKPGGGANLANVLSQQDPGVTDNISGLFSGGGATAAAQGSNALSSILGGSVVSQIGSVLARFTGVGEGVIGKLLGMLAPVVLGVIGKHSKGLDAAGITNMLAGQKENIAAAMPAGLGSMLSSAVPGLGSVLGGPSRATPPVGRLPESGVSPREPVAPGMSALRWIIPLVIAALILYFLPRMFRRTAETPPLVGESQVQEAPAERDGAKVINEGSSLLRDATATIGSITDEASAGAAVPKLRDITAKLGGVRSGLAALPQPVQKAALDHFRPLVANLHAAAQPVLTLPIVGDQVKPAVDGLFSQVDKLMTAPGTP